MQLIRLASFAVALLASASIVAGAKNRPACDYNGDGQAFCENYCGSIAAFCGEPSLSLEISYIPSEGTLCSSR